MRFSPRILSSVAAIAITCVVSAAAYYYKTRNTEINEVMVFCKLQLNVFNSFDRLMCYVDGARRSIDVCMPSIHNPAIQARLVNVLLIKKIKLRIIIDRNGYRESTAFFIRELVDAGAEIKCRVTEPYNKQHKFCVIDGKILLTGTLNWGDDRTSDSWNYVYITNRADLVEPVKKEFEKMWRVDLELEEALKLSPTDYESDQSESPEVNNSDTTHDRDFEDVLENGRRDSNHSESQAGNTVEILRADMLRTTQLTPELCIM